MPTPEGKVKDAVKKVLASFGPDIDTYWPVPAGLGPSHLDCLVCYKGYFIAIEVKAPGKKPTPRQLYRIEQVRAAGGIALIIDGPPGLAQLKEVLEAAHASPRITQTQVAGGAAG